MAISIMYWVSPTGKILKRSNSTHIKEIIENPKLFGVTKRYIIDTYDKYDEAMGTEGKAREEIIKRVVHKGFMRIRLYPNYYWSINIWSWGRKERKILSKWAEDAKNDRKSGPHMPVKINVMVNDKLIDGYTVNDIYSEKHLYEDNEDYPIEPEIVFELEDLEAGHQKRFISYIGE